MPQLPTQNAWSFCHKCNTMFFNGYPTKGICPAGSVHEKAGDFDFVLAHEPAPPSNEQTDWRFCQKCEALFFDGYPTKGTCAAGGVHEKAGSNFVLAHV